MLWSAETVWSVSIKWEVCSALQNLMNQVVSTTTRIAFQDLLGSEEEDHCIEVVDKDTFVADLMDEDDSQGQSCASGEEAGENVLLPSFMQQLATVALCKRICEFYMAPVILHQNLASILRTVRLDQKKSSKQTTLDSLIQYSMTSGTVRHLIVGTGP